MSNESCMKPILISTAALAALIFFLEFLAHGVWLMPLYEDTASLWRPMEEMGPSLWSVLRIFLLAFTFSVLYIKTTGGKYYNEPGMTPRKHGLCFGTILGLLIGTMMASSWLWMPIPAELAMKWFITGLAMGILSGLILSFTCKTKG